MVARLPHSDWSLATRNGSAARWAYRAVVAECLCPSRAPRIGRLKPSSRPIDANEGRKSWSRTSRSAASDRTRAQALSVAPHAAPVWVPGMTCSCQQDGAIIGSLPGTPSNLQTARRSGLRLCRGCRKDARHHDKAWRALETIAPATDRRIVLPQDTAFLRQHDIRETGDVGDGRVVVGGDEVLAPRTRQTTDARRGCGRADARRRARRRYRDRKTSRRAVAPPRLSR